MSWLLSLLFILCLVLALWPVPPGRRTPCTGCWNEEVQDFCKDGCLPYDKWLARQVDHD